MCLQTAKALSGGLSLFSLCMAVDQVIIYTDMKKLPLPKGRGTAVAVEGLFVSISNCTEIIYQLTGGVTPPLQKAIIRGWNHYVGEAFRLPFLSLCLCLRQIHFPLGKGGFVEEMFR